MFNEHGIDFNEVKVIDSRITEYEAALINDAAIVFISGGDTLKLIRYLKDYNLVALLRVRDGITIGMSAGVINMAERVVLPQDLNDNIPELSIYEGIGLVQINIEPHINYMTDEHMVDIQEAREVAPIIGLSDDSFHFEIMM